MTSRDHEKTEPNESAGSKNASPPTTALGPLLQAAKLPKASPARAEPSKPVPAKSPARRPTAEEQAREKEARKRVAALVAGGVHFKVKREGEHVQGARGSAPTKLCARLANKNFAPEMTLDLRTQAGAQVSDSIASFLRLVHRRGVRQLLINVDDGTASEPEREQHREEVIAALTQGAAAPLVRAFSTPHVVLGGIKSLVVLLI